MLSYLRKKKGSKLVKLLLIVLALTFFGGFGLLGYCSTTQKARQREANTAAKVNEDIITRQELARAVRRANLGGQGPETEAEAMTQREDVLETLINRRLILREARKLGVTVSDREITQYITRTFQKDGTFQPRFYRGYLDRLGISESAFEEKLRDELTVSKMQQAMASAAIVTEEDVKQAYFYKNQMVNLALISVNPEDFTDVKEPTREEIAQRYKADPESVVIPEKRQIKYACYKSRDMVNPEELTSEEIREYYENDRDFRYAYTPRKVKARKIYFSSSITASKEEKQSVKQLAREVLKNVKSGEKSFAELAREYSQDPETAEEGGDMGWVPLDEAGFPAGRTLNKLEPGEVSDVVWGFDGYYIFKAEDDRRGKYKPLWRVKDEVIEDLRKKKGKPLTSEAAKSLLDIVRQGTPFEEAAENATHEVEIKTSGFFSEDAKKIDEIENSASMVREAYKLWDIGQVSDPISVKDGSCILQLAEIEPEHIATLEEAIPILQSEMMAQRRDKAAKEMAENILEDIKSGTPFDKAARKRDRAELFETDYFARQKNTIPRVGYAPEMISVMFALPPHDPVARQVFEVSDKYYLAKLLGKKEADPEGYKENASQIRAELIIRRQKEIVDSWVEALRKNAKITRKIETAAQTGGAGGT